MEKAKGYGTAMTLQLTPTPTVRMDRGKLEASEKDEALFTATSAVCVTGLIVGSTGAEMVIIDVETGDRVRQVPFEELGEILNPAYAPDGQAVAGASYMGFTAMALAA